MSYTLTTWDDEVYSLTDAQGKRLSSAWMDALKPFPVSIGETTISSSAIKAIKKNKVTEADRVKANNPNMRLQADSRTEEQIYQATRKKIESIRNILNERRGKKI